MEDAPLAKGEQRWHSSEPDSGPDVGYEIGIGSDKAIWVGEVSRRSLKEYGLPTTGAWWLCADDLRPLAQFVDAESAHEFVAFLTRGLSERKSP